MKESGSYRGVKFRKKKFCPKIVRGKRVRPILRHFWHRIVFLLGQKVCPASLRPFFSPSFRVAHGKLVEKQKINKKNSKIQLRFVCNEQIFHIFSSNLIFSIVLELCCVQWGANLAAKLSSRGVGKIMNKNCPKKCFCINFRELNCEKNIRRWLYHQTLVQKSLAIGLCPLNLVGKLIAIDFALEIDLKIVCNQFYAWIVIEGRFPIVCNSIASNFQVKF